MWLSKKVRSCYECPCACLERNNDLGLGWTSNRWESSCLLSPTSITLPPSILPPSSEWVEAPADTGVCLLQTFTPIGKVRRVDFSSLPRRDVKCKGGRIRPEPVVRTSPVFVYGPYRGKKRVQFVYIIPQKARSSQSVNWLLTRINLVINQPSGKLSNGSFKHSLFHEENRKQLLDSRLMTYKLTLSIFAQYKECWVKWTKDMLHQLKTLKTREWWEFAVIWSLHSKHLNFRELVKMSLLS